MSDIVGIADAAAQIGRSRWWLLRHLRDYEARTGHAILVRVGRGKKRPTYRVHLGRLRMMCPELFDARDPIAAALQQSAIVGRRELEKISGRTEELGENIALLTEAVRRLSRR